MRTHQRDARQGQDGACQYGKNTDEDGDQRNTVVVERDIAKYRNENLHPAAQAKTCCEVTPWA